MRVNHKLSPSPGVGRGALSRVTLHIRRVRLVSHRLGDFTSLALLSGQLCSIEARKRPMTGHIKWKNIKITISTP